MVSLPTNTTGLSVLGFVKWLVVIMAIPFVMKAWQGIVGRETSTGFSRASAGGELVTGAPAIWFGLYSLGIGLVLIGVAWAIWFFWQRYED